MKQADNSPRVSSPTFGSPRLATEVFAWRYGWLWMVAGAATILLIAGVFMILRPLQAELTHAREERIDISAQLSELSRRSKRARSAAAADADLSLQSVLPAATDSDRHIQAIYHTASRRGLQFTRSVLRTTDNPKARISRTEITLPVQGTYPRIAEFVESLLREQPHLSVDQLRFRRDNVAAAEGEAEIRISCWMHSASADPPRPESKRAATQERPS